MLSTRFFAKLMGLWIVLTVLSLMLNRAAVLAMMHAMLSEPTAIFVMGVFTVLFGLVVVLTHNRWGPGLADFLVTLYGWIALVKGLAFLCLPLSTQADLYATLHFAEYFYIYLAVALVLGGYLVLAGFRLAKD